MKKILLFIIILFVFISCNTDPYYELNNLKSPVIIIAMSKTNVDGWSVVMKDSLGKIYVPDYNSILARGIAESKHIGDTIR